MWPRQWKGTMHKGVSGKPGKWVYITPSEFDLVQVKFIWVQTVKYMKMIPKEIPKKMFSRIFLKNFFLPHNFSPIKLPYPRN